MVLSFLTGGFGRLIRAWHPKFSYLKYSIDLLAPHPLGMWEAHRLAVHERLLPLIFIFTSLVASDVGSSYETKQKPTCLQTAHQSESSFKLWESEQKISNKLPGSCSFPTLSPSYRRKIAIPTSLQAASQLKICKNVLQSWFARQTEGQGRNLNIKLELSTTNLQNYDGPAVPQCKKLRNIHISLPTAQEVPAALQYLQLWKRAVWESGYNLPIASGLWADTVLTWISESWIKVFFLAARFLDLVHKHAVTCYT